jgi:HD-GYP domain-containing protein (c-di-GMP phosphodiesterase class II)
MTEEFLSALRRRGVTSVILSNSDIAVLSAFTAQGRRTKVPPAHQYERSLEVNEYSENLDDTLKDQGAPALEKSAEPLADQIDTPTDCPYADGLQNEWALKNNEQVHSVGEFFNQTLESGSRDVGPLHHAVERIIHQISEDKDALICLSSTAHDTEYPSRHGIHLAGVAMTIGVEMGLGESALIDLGVGCLIHDIGMQEIGLRLFENKSTLSSIQLTRLADHPVKALKVACEYGDVLSKASKTVAYQIHERNDGSGYPRGWTADRIHPLAKIAAVADSYVGMLANRKHRLAIQGYHVIAHLLADMKDGKFDPHVIRALLNVSSLYPLGSMVTLNNECVGRVIRSGRDRFVEPTIEMWHKDYQDRAPTIVNLKQEPTIRITGTMPVDAAVVRRAA